MSHSQSIAIIGLGWLGLPLAKQLKLAGYPIMGTTRDAQKQANLAELGIETSLFSLNDDNYPHLKPMSVCNTWVVNIPPGRKSMNTVLFTARMKNLIEAAEQLDVQHFIFISTSSVYGQSFGEVVETTTTAPNTDSGRAHVEIEAYIRTRLPQKSSIMRLAGLVDDVRHPVNFLAGKSDITNPEHSVNLVHKVDVCNAIQKLIAKGPQQQALHLCSAEHPTRKEYYSWAAVQKGLTVPKFVDELDKENEGGKWINCANTLSRLGLTLEYASPYEMLPE
jgi:nucleoside-diphosphate-sugar epimerase